MVCLFFSEIFTSKGLSQISGIFCIGLLASLSLQAQTPEFESWQIPVRQAGEWLSCPFAGGFNAPQFSTADLNHDGIRDIVAFERTGNAMMAFLGHAVPGDSNLTHAPAYEHYLPNLKYWAAFRDFNHDGAADIFAAAEGNPGEYIQVFRGFYRNDTLMFKQMKFIYPDCPTCDPRWLRYNDQTNWYDLTVNFISIPAIEDIDHDGDLDLLAFEAATGEHLWAWHNQAADNNWPDTLLFQLANTCWGGFADQTLASCSKVLADQPDSCAEVIMRPGAINSQTKLHPGAALLAFDPDNDQDVDLLAGTLGLNCLTFLQNDGNNKPWIANQDTMFPSQNIAVDLFSFPAAYLLDLDLDQASDLLISPNSSVIMQDINNVWAYRRTDNQYELIQQDYLSGEMIDIGTGAHPALTDVDGDGLIDLIVGSFGHLEGTNPKFGNLAFYKNTGTIEAPVFELITTDWLSFSQFSPANFDFTPAFGDLDGDKDPDMVVGSATGTLYFVENTSIPGGQVSFGTPQESWFQIDPGVSSTPAIADINSDGLPDLIVGERTGNINFYANKGTAQQPVFSALPDQENWGGILVPASGIGYSTPALFYRPDSTLSIVSGSQNGLLYAWDQADASGNPFPASANWNLPAPVGKRLAPALADLDGDLLLEMAIGVQSGGIRLFKTGIPTTGTSRTDVTPATPGTGMILRPNPARTNIELFTPTSANWQIHDQFGRICGSGKKSAGQLNIDLSGWPAGCYTLSCRSEVLFIGSRTFIVAPK